MLRKCKMVCLPTECCSHQVSKKSINYKWLTSKYSIVEKLAGQAWTRTGKKLAVALGGSIPLATQNCRVVWDILRTLSPSRWPCIRLRNSNFACRQHKKSQGTYKYQHSKATFWFCFQHRRWFWLHFICPKEGDSNVQPKHWYHTKWRHIPYDHNSNNFCVNIYINQTYKINENRETSSNIRKRKGGRGEVRMHAETWLALRMKKIKNKY